MVLSRSSVGARALPVCCQEKYPLGLWVRVLNLVLEDPAPGSVHLGNEESMARWYSPRSQKLKLKEQKGWDWGHRWAEGQEAPVASGGRENVGLALAPRSSITAASLGLNHLYPKISITILKMEAKPLLLL